MILCVWLFVRSVFLFYAGLADCVGIVAKSFLTMVCESGYNVVIVFCEVFMLGFSAELLWCMLAYLVGSISFAIVLSRVFGMPDPRSYGSSNPGATNMLRSGRKEVALLTLLGDALKGFLPVYLAARWGELSPLALAWVAFAAFLGHLYPVFFRFQGGKGVATFLGAVLGLSAQIGLWVIVVWIAMAALFRYSSLASLTASVAALILFAAFWGVSWALLPMMLMVVLMFYRHQGNIQNLLAGKERRLFAPKK